MKSAAAVDRVKSSDGLAPRRPLPSLREKKFPEVMPFTPPNPSTYRRKKTSDAAACRNRRSHSYPKSAEGGSQTPDFDNVPCGPASCGKGVSR